METLENDIFNIQLLDYLNMPFKRLQFHVYGHFADDYSLCFGEKL